MKTKMKNIAKAKDKGVTVRFPKETHLAVKKRAEVNGRSFNAEVITRLNNSLQE